MKISWIKKFLTKKDVEVLEQVTQAGAGYPTLGDTQGQAVL